ncbi:hypothetical protein ACHAPU_010899 [Fusarium lateritium]
MGRRRIEIEKIQEQRPRRATFGKRKSGLFKKAWEFAVLTDSEVLVFVKDERETQYSFTTNKQSHQSILRDVQPANQIGPEDYGKATSSLKTGTPLGDEIVCAPLIPSRPRVSGTTQNHGKESLATSENFDMAISRDFLPTIDPIAECISPMAFQYFLPDSTGFINTEVSSIGYEPAAVAHMDLFPITVPPLLSPFPNYLGLPQLGGSYTEYDNGDLFEYLDGLSTFSFPPNPLSAGNLLI